MQTGIIERTCQSKADDQPDTSGIKAHLIPNVDTSVKAEESRPVAS